MPWQELSFSADSERFGAAAFASWTDLPCRAWQRVKQWGPASSSASVLERCCGMLTKYERNIYAVGPDRIAAPLIEELSVPEILTPFIPGNSGPPGSRQRSLQREAGVCIGDELGDWAAWSVQQIAFIYRLGTARHRDHLGLGINDGSSC